MEQNSDAVAEGKLIGTNTYPQRSEKYKEVQIGGSKIDFYDPRERVVHEIKKSNSMEVAHEWQVKYYIWLLEENGISGVSGILEYPALRETKVVLFTDDDRKELSSVIEQIRTIVSAPQCPQVISAKICKSCSYFDFCYVGE